MTHEPPRYVPPGRDSWRLTFHFDGQSVELLQAERLPMVAPGTVGDPPRGGEQSGAWLEVLDEQGAVIFHRLLHDPFAVRAEHHSPDGRIDVHFRAPGPTDFQAIVPALPDARSVRLWASPPRDDSTQEPAREQGHFSLRASEEEDGHGSG